MGNIRLTANVRIKAEAPFPSEDFHKIIDENYDGNIKEYEKIAKQDFIRAFNVDLGFEEEHINVTKFTVEYIENEEEVAEIER